MKKRTLIIFILLAAIATSAALNLTGKAVTSINACTDTDFGKNYYTAGELFGEEYLLAKTEYSEFDKCLDEKTLQEQYCIRDGISSYRSSIRYLCPEGCSEGKCLGEPEPASGEAPAPECKYWITCKLKSFFLS